MRRPSFTDFDRPYRRGIVLGLSLAELFIILVFLLLLTMIGYVSSRDREVAKATEDAEHHEQAAADAAQAAADAAQAAADAEQDAAEAEQRADDAEQASQEWKDQLGEAKQRAADAQQAIKDVDPNDLINRAQQADEGRKAAENVAGELKDQLGEAEQAAADAEQAAAEAEQRAADSEQAAAEAEQAAAEAEQRAADAEQAAAEAEQRAAGSEQAAADSQSDGGKGEYSSCWFAKDKHPNGEPRERALYIFNLRIRDDSIFVQDISAPTVDYQNQKKMLKFDRLALDRDLTFAEFIKAFHPLYLAGQNKEVRTDRRCGFFVRYWDETTNIADNQKAIEETLELIFYKQRVKGDLWPVTGCRKYDYTEC